MNKAQLREAKEQQAECTFAQKCVDMDSKGLAGRWYQLIDSIYLTALFWNGDDYMQRKLSVFRNGKLLFYVTPETWNDPQAMKHLVFRYHTICIL